MLASAPVNLLAVSIGSSRTRAGAFVGEQLASSAATPNADHDELRSMLKLARAALPADAEVVTLLSSVNAPMTAVVTDMLTQMDGEPQRLERDLPIAIGRQLDREAIVGEDRLLNAAAAFDVLRQACIVVDAGTAITIDLIDGSGTFHGGVIAPGAQLMLRALHEHTASLPQVAFVRPVETIGHNTIEAMRAGVFHGLRGMLRETVEKFAETIGTFAPVIATGGDAETLFSDHELIDRIVPDLTLRGMYVSAKAALRSDA